MPEIRLISTSGSVPTNTQLALGDIGINSYDSRVYYKRFRGNSQEVIPLSNALAYGQWQNNTTLSGSLNTSQSFQYDTTDLTYKTYLEPPSKLYVETSGVFNIQFSAQLEEPGSGAAVIYIWFKRNGVNIPESATVIDLANKGKQVAAWNFMTYLNAGDYVELVWQSDNGSTQILATTAGDSIPAIPSIITTITQVH